MRLYIPRLNPPVGPIWHGICEKLTKKGIGFYDVECDTTASTPFYFHTRGHAGSPSDKVGGECTKVWYTQTVNNDEDIRKLFDKLQKVITCEFGEPHRTFSSEGIQTTLWIIDHTALSIELHIGEAQHWLEISCASKVPTHILLTYPDM